MLIALALLFALWMVAKGYVSEALPSASFFLPSRTKGITNYSATRTQTGIANAPHPL